MSRNYLEAIIVVIIAMAFWFFLSWPKFGDLQDVRMKIDEKVADINSRQEYYANLERSEDRLKKYSESLEKIDSAFPVEADAPSMMNFVQSATIASGMIMKNIDYLRTDGGASATVIGIKSEEETAAVGKYKLQGYEIKTTLSGNYANFKDFLSRLERSSRLVKLTSISVRSADAAKEGEQGEPVAQTSSPDTMDFLVGMKVSFY